MKKIVLIILLFMMFNINILISFATMNIPEEYKYLEDEKIIKNEILVILTNEESKKWKEFTKESFPGINCTSVIDLTNAYNPNNKQSLSSNKVEKDFQRILKITIESCNTVDLYSSIENLKNLDYIDHVEPNQYISFKNENLKLNKSNTTRNVSPNWGYDTINAAEAKQLMINYDTININVGVIEEDIDRTHANLTNVVSNYLSKCFCDDTDFGDVYHDATHHWNGAFYNINNDHGTKVSGIIAALPNSNGMSGVSHIAKVVGLLATVRVELHGNSEILVTASQLAECFNYASEIGLKVINFSAGTHVNDNVLRTAVLNYTGILVCAVGNGHIDIDNNHIYPGCYNMNHIISVGAMDSDFSIYSNYGKNCVDLFAPGVDIYSTSLNNQYAFDSGSSFAAPYVSAVVSMIYSLENNPCVGSLTRDDVKRIIMSSVMLNNNFSNCCVSGGYLNAEQAIAKTLNHNVIVGYSFESPTHHIAYRANGLYFLEEHEWGISLNTNSSILVIKPAQTCLKCGAIYSIGGNGGIIG